MPLGWDSQGIHRRVGQSVHEFDPAADGVPPGVLDYEIRSRQLPILKAGKPATAADRPKIRLSAARLTGQPSSFKLEGCPFKSALLFFAAVHVRHGLLILPGAFKPLVFSRMNPIALLSGAAVSPCWSLHAVPLARHKYISEVTGRALALA
ncbi:hypothetical protein JB92DRAFT_2835411 [Gautieria morchelliformis]|nr:hypothetical protein JB92DRAFT_2835411 [Gautieria morchelliformis]